MGTRRSAIATGIGAALILGWACAGAPAPTPAAPAQDTDYVGHDAQVVLPTLKFQDPLEQVRFNAARDCFAGRHAAGTDAGQQWRHYPLREIGNFVEENWCRGVHSRGCSGGAFRSERGDEWFEVSTLHYDSSWPQVFGIGVSAGQIPSDGDWGVSFSYWANGARIVGEGMSASFHRLEGTEIARSIHLGSAYAYTVEEAHISVAAPGGQDDELARLIASPESLRATALERLDALLVEVQRQTDAGEVQKCVYGAYEGNGIPPECHLTPLTTQERAAALATARADIGAQRADVEQHFETFHRLLTELMVFDKCWGGAPVASDVPQEEP